MRTEEKVFSMCWVWILVLVSCLAIVDNSQAQQGVDKGKPAAESKPLQPVDAYPVIFEAVQKATLSAERAGVLTRIDGDVGTRLKKGTLIAAVDTGELELRKKRNLLSIKYLDVQVNDLDKLSKRGLATNENFAKASMERDVTRTDIEIVKWQIAKSFIHAPFDCIIVRRLVQPHEWVTEGKPVMEIVNSDKLRAVANLPSSLAVNLDKKIKHTFFVNDLNITVTGTLSAIAPQIDELSNTAKVVWDIDNSPEALLSGMKGELRLGK